MSIQQHYSLRWNNHTTNLVKLLADQFEKQQNVDVTISCQGRFIKAHKMVLGACSPQFQELFDAQKSAYPTIIMNNCNFDDVRCIVEFMYKGKVMVPETAMQRFLKTAEDLQIIGLCSMRNKQDSQHQGERDHQQHTPQQANIENGGLSPQGSCRSNGSGGSGGSGGQVPHMLRSRSNSFAAPSSVIGAENSMVGGNNNDGRLPQNKKSWKRAMALTYDAELKRNPGVDNKFDQQVQHQTGTNLEDSAAHLDQSTHSTNDSDFVNMPLSIASPILLGDDDELKHKNSNEHLLLPKLNVVKSWPETEVKREKIPRPPNSFMIFANEWRGQLAGQFPGESNNLTSIRLGAMWKNLTEAAKAKYVIAARRANDDHKKKYPNYQYNPKRARMQKMLKLQQQ